MTLERQIKKALALVIDASEKTIRATAIKLFGAIAEDTPVDTGRLRGNWMAQLNSPSTRERKGVVTAGIAERVADSAIASFDLGDSIFISNNLPYAKIIEEGNSRIRPHGMVRRNVAAFDSELRKQAKKHRIR